MRAILDTSALFRPAALADLARQAADMVLPAVAYAERLRQVSLRGQRKQEFDAFLVEMGVRIEPFGPDEAARFVPGLVDGPTWERLARDAMIAGHLGPGDLLWTTNPKDFLVLGVPKDQIMALA